MSRFEDTLQRDLHVIADRATPSPDAWALIQSRIDAEEPFQETEIIMLTENTLTRRRWPLVAAAAAVVTIAIGAIALVNRGDGAEQPADVPTPTVEPAPDPDADSSPEGALELPPVGSQVTPGRYTSDAVGVNVTFTLDEGQTAPWTLRSNQAQDGIQLWSDDSGREFVAIGRVGSWYDAAEARDGDMTGLGSLSPADIDGWIEQNGIIVTESADVQVGNRPAQYRQIRLDTSPGASADFCPSGEQPCLWAATGSADTVGATPGPIPFSRDRLHSIWLVDMDDYEPLVILAIPNLDDEQTWFDTTVQPIVDSMEFGEPAPIVEGGTARISTFAATPETRALPSQGAVAPPGRYTTDAFGVPASFEIPDVASSPWTVGVNNQEAIVLARDENAFVAIKRVGSFFDADQAVDPSMRGLGSIPPDGIDEFIAVNGLIVDESTEVTVGGRTAQFRRLRIQAGVGGELCQGGIPSPCLNMISSSADQQGFDSFPTIVATELPNSFWFVDMGDFEPLGIWASTTDQDHQAWLDELAPLIASIEFGEPGPAVAGGTARLPLRVAVSAPFSGVRTNGDQLADGSTSITYAATSEGPVAGEIVGTGWAIPGNPTVGHDENTFTGTIEGVGTGTISWTVDWTGTNPADLVSTDVVTGGTGDFAGVTGMVPLDLESSSQVGGVDTVAGTYTFELVIPRSG